MGCTDRQVPRRLTGDDLGWNFAAINLARIGLDEDKKRMAMRSGRDTSVTVRDVRSGTVLTNLEGHNRIVIAAAFSPDGHRVVTGSTDKTASVWDLRTGKPLLDLKGHGQELTCVAFSRDGAWIATGDLDGWVYVWGAPASEARFHLRAGSQVHCAAFQSDGQRLATGCQDGTARVWDVATGTQMLSIAAHKGPVTMIAFDKDGNRLVAGADTRTMKVWDARDGTHRLDLESVVSELTTDWTTAFTPDGKRVFARNPRISVVWNATTGAALREKAPNGDAPLLSADKRYFAHISRDSVEIIDLLLSAKEREYRLFWTRPRPDIHREELARALAAKDMFATDFHLDRLLASLDPRDADAGVYLDVDFHRRPAAVANLFAAVFAANPKLAADTAAEHRHHAACYAALAGSGKGRDAEKLDDNERSGWHRQALDWLLADLAVYAKKLDGGQKNERDLVRHRLGRWKDNPDLAGIRDDKALANLPAAEREACRALWAEVEALLLRAEKSK
jgi:hypothetical protein